MKKISLILAISVLCIGCKEGKKKDNPNIETPVPVVEEVIEKLYPKLENAPEILNIIFDNGYEFKEDIKVEYIALEHIAKDNYQFIVGLSDDSNFEKIESLRFSAVFYADNPKEFKNPIYQKRKSRQVPAICKISTLDGDKVIAYNFDIIPKNFHQIKFYFYDDSGVTNDKIMTVREIDLPK